MDDLRRDRLANWLGRLIFGALLVLLALVAVPYGTVEPWWEAVFECYVFGLSALCLVEFLLSGSLQPNRFSLLVPPMALALFGFLQSLPLRKSSNTRDLSPSVWRAVSADPYGTRRFVLVLLALVLAGGLLLRYTSSRKRLQILIHAVIAVGLASAVFGIARQTVFHGSFLLPYLEGPGTYAQFVSKNYFAYLMEMALGLLAGFTIGGGIPRKRILVYVTALIIMWAALVMSDSRGGILALACQLFFLSLLFSASRNREEKEGTSQSRLAKLGRSYASRAVLVVGLLLVLSLSIIWIGGEPLVSHLERAPDDFSQKGAENHRNTSRLDIWRASWRLFKANPVWGAGFGGYWIAVTKHHPASGEYTPQQAHNDYLEALACGGIVGAVLLLWFFATFIRAAHIQLQVVDQFRHAATLGALVGLFGVAVHSLVDFGLHARINALIFVVLAVIATVKLPLDDPATRWGPDSTKRQSARS